MKNIYFQTISSSPAICIYFVSLFFLTGCGQVNIESVKQGTLDFDESVTVGDALDGYEFFAETAWETFEDPQGREIVEFNGVIDLNAFIGQEFIRSFIFGMPLPSSTEPLTQEELRELLINYKEFGYKARQQFLLSKRDDSFEIGYGALEFKMVDNEGNVTEGEVTSEQMQESLEMDLLDILYENIAMPTVCIDLGVLLPVLQDNK